VGYFRSADAILRFRVRARALREAAEAAAALEATATCGRSAEGPDVA